MNIEQLKSHDDLISHQYPDLKVNFNTKTKIVWSFMHSGPRPCYTPDLLSNLKKMLINIKTQSSGAEPVEYLVVGSLVDNIYSLGGDLDLFSTYINDGDRDKLKDYAYSCIDLVYNCSNQIEQDVTSIALVQGSALGGGFEAALSCHYIVAEESAQFGFPEILFNLFPGMGAFTYLSRRISMRDAEQLILSGKQYSASELYEMGIVDVLVEDGQGVNEVNKFIDEHKTQQSARLAMQKAKMRTTLITYDELRDIADIWVDAALKTNKRDIDFIKRLIKIQNRKFMNNAQVHHLKV